ncbi:MAG TPA: CHASE3 domain-containing protein, partial [Gemmatimonadaceae bacterium]|nr:CHASE3 domain-containing protein [Gemmatimonadaceae bacterium]
MSRQLTRPELRRRRSRWWLSALLIVPLVLASGMYSLWQLSRANEWVEHTHEVRLSLASLLSMLVDSETGVRGYVMTGNRAFLEPHDRAVTTWSTELAHLRALTADNPAQQARLAGVERFAKERLGYLDELRSDYDAGRRGDALSPSMFAAKRTMDALRALLAESQKEEARLDAVRQHAAAHRRRVTLLVFVGGTAAFLLFVLVAWRLRAKAEAEQHSAEEQFRLMVESVKDYAIITLDREGRVTSWNRGAEAIKGYRSDEIIGQHFSRFYLPEEVRAGKCERELETIAREGRFEEESWRVRKDGSLFWANVVINAVKDERGKLVGFTKVTRDLTERKTAAEALADEYQRRTDAERETRFAQMFVGILGHDLRNPLNAISMAARLAKKKIDNLDPKVIDRIGSSAQRMANMVDQLLDLTRSKLAGGIPFEKKSVELSAVIAGAVEELRLAHPDREIRWTSRASTSHCAWDPDRMAQVASNLIGNAIQHSEPATPITVQLSNVAGEVVLSVHNLGPPIPPD